MRTAHALVLASLLLLAPLAKLQPHLVAQSLPPTFVVTLTGTCAIAPAAVVLSTSSNVRQARNVPLSSDRDVTVEFARPTTDSARLDISAAGCRTQSIILRAASLSHPLRIVLASEIDLRPPQWRYVVSAAPGTPTPLTLEVFNYRPLPYELIPVQRVTSTSEVTELLLDTPALELDSGGAITLLRVSAPGVAPLMVRLGELPEVSLPPLPPAKRVAGCLDRSLPPGAEPPTLVSQRRNGTTFVVATMTDTSCWEAELPLPDDDGAVVVGFNAEEYGDPVEVQVPVANLDAPIRLPSQRTPDLVFYVRDNFGRPVPGATITTVLRGAYFSFERVGTADEKSGRALLHAGPPDNIVRVDARREGYFTNRFDGEDARSLLQDGDPFTLTIEPARVLNVRVVTEAGLPIGGARVSLDDDGEVALTDERGVVQRSVSVGPHTVAVAISRFIDGSASTNVTATNQLTQVVVVMRRGSAIHVAAVYADGQPASHLELRALRHSDSQPADARIQEFDENFFARTDQNGAAMFEGLRSGNYTLEAVDEMIGRHAQALPPVFVDDSIATLDLPVPGPMAKVHLDLALPVGSDLPDRVRVSATEVDEQGAAVNDYPTFDTDLSEPFQVLPGRHRLRVETDDGDFAFDEQHVQIGPGRNDVQVEGHRVPALTIRVVEDVAGVLSEKQGFKLKVIGDDGRAVRTLDGASSPLRLRGLSPKRYFVVAETDDTAPAFAVTPELKAGGDDAEIELRVATGFTFQVRTEGGTPDPMTLATLVRTDVPAKFALEISGDPQGTDGWEFYNVVSGTYQLILRRLGTKDVHTVPLRITSASTVSISLPRH